MPMCATPASSNLSSFDAKEGSKVGGKKPSEELEGREDAVFKAVTEESGVPSDNGNDAGCRNTSGGQEVQFGEKHSGEYEGGETLGLEEGGDGIGRLDSFSATSGVKPQMLAVADNSVHSVRMKLQPPLPPLTILPIGNDTGKQKQGDCEPVFTDDTGRVSEQKQKATRLRACVHRRHRSPEAKLPIQL
ncbi:hypothetical protein V8G54_013384 [Vigna mungo]|uniref:Uncharacterized protein n=1 Tax=Vigna mungo TaxID=3915 RepID=A0AAQ3NWU8_VIGMU